MIASSRLAALAILLVTLAWAPSSSGQWVSQIYDLNVGWNAIWLPIDCTYAPIEAVLKEESGITEVIRFNPLASDTQYVTGSSTPISQDAEWAFWPAKGPNGELPASLSQLTGNAAYMVKSAKAQQLTLKGKPLVPSFGNNIKTGMNIRGFPISSKASGKKTWAQFFLYDQVLAGSTAYKLALGNSDTWVNAWVKATPSLVKVKRGEAISINSKDYSAYYGPVRVTSSGGGGLDFGTTGTTQTLTLTNATNGTSAKSVDVTIKTDPSEDSPVEVGGAKVEAVELLTKGDPDPTTGLSAFTPFTGGNRTIKPGEEVEMAFYVDRRNMKQTDEGLVYQSLLTVTDSLDLTEVTVPVRAGTTSPNGIWVGEVAIDQVEKFVGDTPTLENSSAVSFHQRLIVFVQGEKATLLQQVYIVPDTVDSDKSVAMTHKVYSAQSAPGQRSNRISSSTFPLDLEVDAPAALKEGTPVTFTFTLERGAATNPFLHAFHPQHDNLDTDFTTGLLVDRESYEITRTIELSVDAPAAGSNAPSWGSDQLGGTYTETITGLRKLPVTVKGKFTLSRIPKIRTLQR